MWTSVWPADGPAAPYSCTAPSHEVAAVLAEDQLMVCARTRLTVAVHQQSTMVCAQTRLTAAVHQQSTMVCAQIRQTAAVHQQKFPGRLPLFAVIWTQDPWISCRQTHQSSA